MLLAQGRGSGLEAGGRISQSGVGEDIYSISLVHDCLFQ